MAHQHRPVSSIADRGILGGLSHIAGSYDVLLCDVWGVLHNGVAALPAATEALTRFRAAGGTVVLITNSPRPNGPVREQMRQLGVPRAAYDDVVTSGDVTIASIVQRGSAPLYHIGPNRDATFFEEVRVLGGQSPPMRPLTEATYVVVTGLFNDETDTLDLYDAQLAAMRARDLTLICANPDIVVHVGDTLRYCAGAIGERYREQGGAVVYAGKPHAPIYQAALASAQRLRGAPTPLSRVLAIGDAFHTDVAGALRQGIDVLFVTSGIHRDEAHRGDDGRLDLDAYETMIAANEHRPSAAIAALAW